VREGGFVIGGFCGGGELVRRNTEREFVACFAEIAVWRQNSDIVSRPQLVLVRQTQALRVVATTR